MNVSKFKYLKKKFWRRGPKTIQEKNLMCFYISSSFRDLCCVWIFKKFYSSEFRQISHKLWNQSWQMELKSSNLSQSFNLTSKHWTKLHYIAIMYTLDSTSDRISCTWHIEVFVIPCFEILLLSKLLTCWGFWYGFLQIIVLNLISSEDILIHWFSGYSCFAAIGDWSDDSATNR